MNSVQGPDGEKYIPASQRPDGTWRRARRIKDGYVPQDEVPLYQSRGKQWAERRVAGYPVGMDPALIKKKEAEKAAALEKELIKKRNQKLKKALNISNSSSDSSPSPPKPTSKVPSEKATPAPPTPQVLPEPKQTDPAKRLRNLKKKLSDIESLELKIKNKELKNPDKDQLNKIKRKTEVLDEIMALELSLGLSVDEGT